MKLETAFQVIRLLSEKRKGFAIKLHVSPEAQVTLEKPITIKDELEPSEIVEKLVQQ